MTDQSTATQTHEALRAFRGRGTKRLPLDLAVGDVVRVDGTKYRVQEPPTQEPVTGTVVVAVYSEDNQHDTLYLGSKSPVTLLGALNDTAQAATTWKRNPYGYVRSDGAWYLERGARMSDGGTNAWLIHRRVDETRIGRDSSSAYDTTTGNVLWGVTADGMLTSVDSDHTGDLYAHDFDAGSLAEAKETVETVETEGR